MPLRSGAWSRPNRTWQTTPGKTMEGRPERLRHQNQSPNPPGGQLEMPMAVIPKLGQSHTKRLRSGAVSDMGDTTTELLICAVSWADLGLTTHYG
jgi:hypothetical protein